jgi:tRNA dimethylallyltransferase
LAESLLATRGSTGEIVSADSRQVYRTLDIGTAKPTLDDQRRVRHHVIDLVDPRDDFTVADFQDHARLAIEATYQRGGIPILVGGTGLYVRAIADGLELPRVPPDPILRASLERVARESGPDELFRRLVAVDSVASTRIDPRNVRRVVRALEVIEKTGRRFSDSAILQPRYDVMRIGLTLDRDRLYRQIDDRVDQQMAAGLIDETQDAIERGCSTTRPALTGFGYRQVVQYLAGELDLTTAIQVYKFETHRFARQQYSWFRLGDSAIRWFEPNSRSLSAVTDTVNQFLDAACDSSEEAQQ